MIKITSLPHKITTENRLPRIGTAAGGLPRTLRCCLQCSRPSVTVPVWDRSSTVVLVHGMWLYVVISRGVLSSTVILDDKSAIFCCFL